MEIKKDICLKNIIKEKLDEYDEKSSIIFTTYDYDTTFFEVQLLPYLFDTEKYIKSQKRSKLIAHELDQKLKEVDLKVFYNHFKGDIQANINYKSFENPNIQMLHAKIIIIIGKKDNIKKMTVIISSANLTTSSYGTNLETVGTIENCDIDIINKIERNDSLNDILGALNDIKELAITGIGYENKIEKELNNSKKIDVITPFLEEQIIDNYEKNHKLNIIFTNLRGLKNKYKYKDFDFIKVYPKIERNIHSKIYLLDEKTVIIGSHNFTTSAIKGRNIEASLIYKNKKINKECRDFFNNISSKCKDLNIVLDNEINDISENETIRVKQIYISKAEIDWENEKILFELKPKSNNSCNIKKLLFKIEKTDIKKTNINFNYKNKCWNFEEKITEKLKDSIFENKSFKMNIELDNNINEELLGILYEKNPIDKIYTIKGRNFNEILNPNYYNDNSDYIDDEEDINFKDISEKNKYQNNIINENQESQAYNITDMFFAFKELNNEINQYIENNQEDKIKEIYITGDKSSKSIKRLSYLFNIYFENEENMKNNKRKVLYYLLTCNELKLLWNKKINLLKILKKDKEIKNIIKTNNKNFELLKGLAINLMHENKEFEKKVKELEIQKYLLNLFLNKF